MSRSVRMWLLALLLPFAVQAEPKQFTSVEHHISGMIPDGWNDVAGANRETALKISKAGAGDNTARISVMTYAVSAGSFPAGYDVWSMSDDDIQHSGESGSVDGEAVKVLKSGRAEIDHHHMVWTLNSRTLPDGASMWQLAYEGMRGPEGITVQLTVAGDEEWYAANEKVFLIFIRVLKLSAPKTAG